MIGLGVVVVFAFYSAFRLGRINWTGWIDGESNTGIVWRMRRNER